MMNRTSLALLLACSSVTLANAQDSPEPSPLSSLQIVQERLDNGLRVVMSPNPGIPTVAIAVYYDVGSRNEVQGRSGFAHLFEHMMFEGSANVESGEHFRFIMNRGGSVNGTTNADRTNYFETLPSNELALGLWLESDRMRSLAITEENFENQRQVVMEERRQRYDNQPYVPSFLRINELAYGSYWPYSHSTIGDMADLTNAPLSAVQEFWTQYYGPNNATLTIVGDFDPAAAMTLVRQYFSDIGSREVPPYAPPPIEAQAAEVTDTIQDQHAELPGFHVAYRIPPSREPDHYALEMLALVLGHGDSSRLYQQLVKEREICQSITVYTDDSRGPDLFGVWAIMADGHEGAEARELIYREFANAARRGVSARELERAQNQVRSMFVFSLQSNLTRAQLLSEFELYWGDARLFAAELDRYLAVTVADIRRVAGQYLQPQNRTVLDVIPAAGESEAAAGGES